MLRPGDPCPCCGQAIKTSDHEILSLLTYIQEIGVNQKASRRFVPAMGRGNGRSFQLLEVLKEEMNE